jgi:hypothetical protein
MDMNEHLKKIGEQNIAKCIENDAHNGCKNDKCQVSEYFLDLDDTEIKGALKIFSRYVSHRNSCSPVQLFQHLVAENLERERPF